MSERWKAGTGQKIAVLYAWVALEADGGEGLVAGDIGGRVMPLVGADRARIESLRPYAEAAARITGLPVLLKLYSGGVVIDDVSGK